MCNCFIEPDGWEEGSERRWHAYVGIWFHCSPNPNYVGGDYAFNRNRTSVGYYDAREDGAKLLGKRDNQAFFSLLSAKRGGHTFYVDYQAMYGDSAFPRVFANVTPLDNEVPTYEFAYTDERSWQARYDYDFAALGIEGLTTTVRYITGNNVTTGADYEGWAC